ncbi:MAG: phosphoribosylglycinamide formyltransferase [Candidatus Zixiibacteriota bacterium]
MNDQKRARIAVFISGSGTGLQSLIDASRDGSLHGDIVLVVSSNDKAYGLVRALNAGIPTFVFKERQYDSPDKAASTLLSKLRDQSVEFIAMAGYLKMMPTAVLRAFPKRVTNIHPALLPKYGGKGMYGHFVHEAVLASGDTESGATVHLADEVYDHGRILEQVRVPIMSGDTPDMLAARVQAVEHQLYTRALDKLIRGEYKLA